MGWVFTVSLPLCIREKSSSSSTRPDNLSASLNTTSIPRATSSSSVPIDIFAVSPQPLIAVSGVRSSCDTEEMKSFLISSAC